MATRDLFHSITELPSLLPQVHGGNTTLTGSAVDTFGYESVTLSVEVATRTDGTFTFKVQDCDTSGGSYADIDPTCYMAGAAPSGITAAGITLFGLKDCSAASPTTPGQLRRFLKVVETATSVTTGATVRGSIILGHPHHRSAAG